MYVCMYIRTYVHAHTLYIRKCGHVHMHMSVPPGLYGCRPMINEKLEDKTCGDGPNLRAVLEDDQCLVELCNGCLVSTVTSTTSTVLQVVCVYVRKFVQLPSECCH